MGGVVGTSFQHNLDVGHIPRPHSAHPCLLASSPNNLLSPMSGGGGAGPGGAYSSEQRRSSMSGPCESSYYNNMSNNPLVMASLQQQQQHMNNSPIVNGIGGSSGGVGDESTNNLLHNLSTAAAVATAALNTASNPETNNTSLPTSPHHNNLFAAGANVRNGISGTNNTLQNEMEAALGMDGMIETSSGHNGGVEKKFAAVMGGHSGGALPMDIRGTATATPTTNNGLNGSGGENEEAGEVWQDIVRQLAVS